MVDEKPLFGKVPFLRGFGWGQGKFNSLEVLGENLDGLTTQKKHFSCLKFGFESRRAVKLTY